MADDAGVGESSHQSVPTVVPSTLQTASLSSTSSSSELAASRDQGRALENGHDSEEAGDVIAIPVSISQDNIASTPVSSTSVQLPPTTKRDSTSSFTTAPDRNSLLMGSPPHGNGSSSNSNSKRDTMGSLAMAKIAETEEPSSSATATLPSSPAVSRPSTGPRLENTGNIPAGVLEQEVLAGPSSMPSPHLAAQHVSATLSSRPSSSSLASSSSSSKRNAASTGTAGGASASNSTRPASDTFDKSASRDSLQPVAPPSLSSSSSSRSLRERQEHSTLPQALATATNSSSNTFAEQKERATPTPSSHHHSQHKTSTSKDNVASPSLAGTASSSTPRLTMPTATGSTSRSNSRSSIADGSQSAAFANTDAAEELPATEAFEAPVDTASPTLPALQSTPPYPQSHSSPNLQQQQQQPLQDLPSSGWPAQHIGESQLRGLARYSHAGFSNTHPPVSQPPHAAALHSQRASAPILAPALPPNAYGSSGPAQSAQQVSDLAYVSSPINILSDAGFGSSSPYPPLGAQQQQRYSFPVQASSAIPTFSQPFSHHQGNASMPPAASLLRPQPTTSYGTPGQSTHLPEMHPSALEARPSISAPFPPSSSPPRAMKINTATIAAPAALQQRERPDTTRPLGQEICLECLMRDRDMADVEVTGPGVWSRNSDIDFEEALRAEEIAVARANNANSTTNGYHTGSSAEDGNDVERRSYALHRNGSTDENYSMPMPPQQDGRYVARDGGQIRSPSRESSVSGNGPRAYRRQGQPMRRRLGSHDPLTSASLKLWTAMNHVSSAHRYKVLSDFVLEQTRLLDQERRAHEQSVVERDRADRAIRDSPAKMSLDTRSSMSSGLVGSSGTVSPKLLDLRRGSKGRIPPTQLLPNGMTVETIDVQWDEKEAKARAKAARSRRGSAATSPIEQRKSFAPSIKSFNALTHYNSHQESLPSPTGSFAPPWMADERRRFSSPMLSSKYRNASSDNLPRNKHYNEVHQDMRMSSHSMMTPPLRAMRSPSPSRQSFQTGASQRDSRGGWRRSLWPRSATASVVSFPRSGSMMEMHLGMSQDKHEPVPSGYPHDTRDAGGFGSGMHAPGGTWPDNASELGEPGGISPDENVEAAKTKKQKKKRFQKLFNSLLGTHHSADASKNMKRSEHVDQYAPREQHDAPRRQEYDDQTVQAQRRQTGFNYATAAYQEDYSEPLAPPPPLSYLTGQQPHSRSYSSSSQSSVTPPGPTLHQQQDPVSYQSSTRPNSLTVPRNNTNSSNGFVSPSTSSSDLNRNRPSSVTSWRSSSNKTTGSPQSPRELLGEGFGHSLPAIRQASIEELAPGLRVVTGIDMVKDSQINEIYKLRREKSLPALPPGENDGSHPPMPGQDYFLQQQVPNVSYNQISIPRAASYGAPPVHAIAPPMHEIYGTPNDQYAPQFPGNGPEWDYAPQGRDLDYDGTNSIGKPSRKPKMRSRLFSFGTKKSRSSTSPPPLGQQEAHSPKGFAPHETALQAVVRDQSEMVAYRYPSTTTHA